MADNSENILVEFDYNNITIIDPNKVIDENGNAKDRYVKQEDLVMYANITARLNPDNAIIDDGVYIIDIIL
jgi:5-methylcytosine-specific restriction endonuclease McrBC GTP-binding regulatory subunit McrB